MQRRVASGRWERVQRNVFRITGSPPSWRQALFAACLSNAPGAFVSHLSAAPLWKLPGFPSIPVEIVVPRSRRRRRDSQGVVIRRLGPLPVSDVTVLDGIPVTTPARTLIDIGALVAHDVLEEALDDALRRGLVSFPRLRWRLSELGRQGRQGTTAMRNLLAERDPSEAVQASVFETRLKRILDDEEFPPVIPQHPVVDGRRVVAVLDFAFPSEMVAIEADGYRWHSGRARWQRDLTRRNELTALGWRIVHVTWADLVADPAAVKEQVRRVLHRIRD